MSTGYRSSGNLSYDRYGYMKYWGGGNGKETVINGRKATQWNDYHMVLHEQSSVPGVGNETGNDYFISVGCFDPSRMWDNNSQLQLLSRVANAAVGHQFNLAVSAAEAKQTLQLATSTVSTLARSIRKLQRGDIRGAAEALGVDAKRGSRRGKTANNASSRWLELQYGWLPLLNDVHNAAEAAAKHMSPPRIERITASASQNGIVDGSCSGDYRGDGKYKSRGRVIFEMREDLPVARSLGLENPQSVAWEKTPWSFVIDWFIPVSTYFSVLGVIPHLVGRGQFSVKREWIGKGEMKRPGPTEGAKTIYHFVQFDRNLGVPSVPPPQFKPLGDVLSPKRLLNAMALGYQAIAGR